MKVAIPGELSFPGVHAVVRQSDRVQIDASARGVVYNVPPWYIELVTH